MRLSQTKALFFATPSTQHNAIPSATTLIEYNEELQHHVVTVPPFFLSDDQIIYDDYPSPLHRVHVMPLLTDLETTNLLQMARTHATENNSWDRQDSTRHASYPTVDFAVEECIELSHYLGESGIGFEERIFGALSHAYDIDAEDMSFLDLFCASYEAKECIDELNDSGQDRNTMDHLDFHRDGSLLSFTVLLSSPDSFEGGGTIFDALGDIVLDGVDTHSILHPRGVIRPPHAGYVVMHSGKLFHGGHMVTKGQRVVLVGFVEIHDRNLKSGALHNATKEWGRNDVRLFWNRRRLSLLKQQQKRLIGTIGQPIWNLKSGKYIPKATEERRTTTSEGRSFFSQSTSLPATILRRIEDRAREDRIRKRRLATEDKFLREYLLPRNERLDKNDGQGQLVELNLDDGLIFGWDDKN
jgi:hypothetical protein